MHRSESGQGSSRCGPWQLWAQTAGVLRSGGAAGAITTKADVVSDRHSVPFTMIVAGVRVEMSADRKAALGFTCSRSNWRRRISVHSSDAPAIGESEFTWASTALPARTALAV